MLTDRLAVNNYPRIALWLSALVMLNIYDIWSTYVTFSHGAEEANLLLPLISNNHGINVAYISMIKAGWLVVLGLLTVASNRHESRLLTKLLPVSAMAYATGLFLFNRAAVEIVLTM